MDKLTKAEGIHEFRQDVPDDINRFCLFSPPVYFFVNHINQY